MVRGSKHWPLKKQNIVWDWLTPRLPAIFEGITPETQVAWEMCAECRSMTPSSVATLTDTLPDPQISSTLETLAEISLSLITSLRSRSMRILLKLSMSRRNKIVRFLILPVPQITANAESCFLDSRRNGFESARLAFLTVGFEIHRGSYLFSFSFRARTQISCSIVDVLGQHCSSIPRSSISNCRQPSKPLRAPSSPVVRIRRTTPSRLACHREHDEGSPRSGSSLRCSY